MSNFVQPSIPLKNKCDGSLEEKKTFIISKIPSIHTPKSERKINCSKPSKFQDTNVKQDSSKTFSPITIKDARQKKSSPQWFTPAARLKVSQKENIGNSHFHTPAQRMRTNKVQGLQSITPAKGGLGEQDKKTSQKKVKQGAYESFSPIKSTLKNISSTQRYTSAERLKVNQKEDIENFFCYTPAQRVRVDKGEDVHRLPNVTPARALVENNASQDTNVKQDLYETFNPIGNMQKNNSSLQWFTPAARLKVKQEKAEKVEKDHTLKWFNPDLYETFNPIGNMQQNDSSVQWFTPAARLKVKQEKVEKVEKDRTLKCFNPDLYETFNPIGNMQQNNSSIQWFTPAARLKVKQEKVEKVEKDRTLKWFTPARRVKISEANKQEMKDEFSSNMKFKNIKSENSKVLHKPSNYKKHKLSKPVNRKLELKHINIKDTETVK